MQRDRVDELLLARYLLGNLTEEEQAQVEDRAFADPDYLAAMNAAEADLIDAYVRGELAQPDRRAFERLFLTSPKRRGKVEFAQALARVTAETAPLPSPLPQRESASSSIWNPIRAWNPALRFAGALGAAVCIAGGSWLWIENRSIRSRFSLLETQSRELESRNQSLRQELSQAQDRAAALAAQGQNRPEIVIPSLVLIPGISRSGSRVEQLVLDRQARLARLEIVLESRDEYPRFRAELRTGGKQILVLGDLIRRRNGDVYSISVDIPASLLASGEYELALEGLRGSEVPQDIGYYYFRVQK